MLYAGFLRRLAASIIDHVILYIPVFIISWLADSGMQDGVTAVDYAANFGALVIWWLYFALLESSPRQASLGKIAIGVKVTDLAGARVSFGRATGRTFWKIPAVLAFLVGIIMIAFTAKKQGLHDILAKTLVVLK